MNAENIFDENIKVFERFCPKLVEEVVNANCENYELTESESGDLNILKKSDEGDFYFHSRKNPKLEAELWFNSLIDIDQVDIIVVFGVGLGYYYYACKEWLEKDPQRLLIFIENDFSLLKFFFQTEQSREIQSDPQVGIIGAKKDILEEGKVVDLEYLGIVALLMPEHHSQLSELKSYSNIYQEYWREVKRAILFYAQEVVTFSSFFKPKTLQRMVSNAMRNFFALPESKLFYGLEKCLKGVPAIICGAGPSLKADLPLLKEIQDYALVLGAGTGMNILNKNDIFPKLGVMIDPYDTTRSRILTNYSYEVPFCYHSDANHDALNLLHSTKLFFKGIANYGIDIYLESVLGLEEYPRVHSPLTTTQACLGIASLLGCDPIVLLGVDLAYTDRQRYPEDVKDHPLDKRSEHFNPGEIHQHLIVLSKAKDGGLVETRADWIREASLFETYQKKHPEEKIINATSSGLMIPEVTSSVLEEVVQNELECAFDIENLIHAEVENSPYVDTTKQQIFDALGKMNEMLEDGISQLSDIMEELSVMLKRLSEDPDLEEEKLRKNLSELLYEFQQSDLYRYILHVKIEKFMSIFFRRRYSLIFRPEQFTDIEKNMKKIEVEIGLYLFFIYFTQIIKSELDKSVENEKSQALSSNENDGAENIHKANDEQTDMGEYKYEDNMFIIHDEELDIHWEEEFVTKKISDDRKALEGSVFVFASNSDNKPEGQCASYYPNGNLKYECFYKNGKIHGPSTFFSESGNILAKGWFIDNKKQGKNLQYYSSEKIYSILRYKDGIQHGEQSYFYESGIKKTSMTFNEGRLEGYVYLYYSNGAVKREIPFKGGLLTGVERMWDSKGSLVLETEYLENEPVGYSRSWYPNGQIKEERKYYDSAKNFDLTSWSEDGLITEKKLFMPAEVGKQAREKSEKARQDLKKMKEKLKSQGSKNRKNEFKST